MKAKEKEREGVFMLLQLQRGVTLSYGKMRRQTLATLAARWYAPSSTFPTTCRWQGVPLILSLVTERWRCGRPRLRVQKSEMGDWTTIESDPGKKAQSWAWRLYDLFCNVNVWFLCALLFRSVHWNDRKDRSPRYTDGGDILTRWRDLRRTPSSIWPGLSLQMEG